MDDPWVFVTYVNTDAEDKVTSINTLFWQIGHSITYQGTAYQTPGWDDIFKGRMEEFFGLDPEAIIGAWLSPFLVADSGTPYTHVETVEGVTTYHAAYQIGNVQSSAINYHDLGADVMTDDSSKWVFYDVTGAEMFTVPWGLPFRYIIFQIDAGSVGCSMQIYLMDEAEADSLTDGQGNIDFKGGTKAAEGRLFSFPLPTLPVTQNAWASYNYSGQRDYDIQAREIQKNQNAVNGIAGVGTSAIGGAVAGSMVAPGPGTIAGAVGGAASALFGTALNYFTSGYFDNQTQEAIDRRTASQTAGMIMTACGRRGVEPLGKTKGWLIMKMIRDSTSLSELETEQEELGYVTDVFSPDCSALITQGGGLRIENLEVKGDISPEGRRYIAALFARGVHLDLIS